MSEIPSPSPTPSKRPDSASADYGLARTILDALSAHVAILNKTLLAFQCHDLKPSALNDGELDKLKALESKLGVSLVAVEA